MLYISACVSDLRMNLMIDTGATRTFISMKCFKAMKEKRVVNQQRHRVFLADGHTYLMVYGEVNTSIRAFMVEGLCAGCILGMDFIRKYNLIIGMKKQVI